MDQYFPTVSAVLIQYDCFKRDLPISCTLFSADVMAIPSSNRRWCLTRIRQAKGISLTEIAGRTKLRVAIVKAIEDGNFDELPGGIYNISYLRQYAREVGADENLLVHWYEHGYDGPDLTCWSQDDSTLPQKETLTPSHEDIALRAYELWQQRGCPEDGGHQDWLEAERQLSQPDGNNRT